MISMETILEGNTLQMMPTLLQVFPVDLIKHFCTHYSYCVNLIHDYVLLLYPQLKTANNDT